MVVERKRLTMLEAALWLVTLGCGAVCVSSLVEAQTGVREAGRIAVGRRIKAGDGVVFGRLEIAELSLSTPVLENYDPVTLRRGVGHVWGTAVPGGLGNMVLAGHRDTFFRPLRGIKTGMKIEISTGQGHWFYGVDGTEIVTPDQVRVLEIGERPEMTLITCYPFEFIGSAPKRFIVHAHLLSVEAGVE